MWQGGLKRLSVLLVLVLLAAAACGGGGSEETGEAEASTPDEAADRSGADSEEPSRSEGDDEQSSPTPTPSPEPEETDADTSADGETESEPAPADAEAVDPETLDFEAALLGPEDLPQVPEALPATVGEEIEMEGVSVRGICGDDPAPGRAVAGHLREIEAGEPLALSVTSSVHVLAEADVDDVVEVWTASASNCSDHVGPGGVELSSAPIYRSILLNDGAIDESTGFAVGTESPFGRVAIIDVLFARGRVLGGLRIIWDTGTLVDGEWLSPLVITFGDRLDDLVAPVSGSGSESESASGPSGDPGSGDGADSVLPPPVGECAGAEFEVLAVSGVPFGQTLTSQESPPGSVDVRYLFPEGASDATISVRVTEARGITLTADEIVAEFPDADPPGERFSISPVSGFLRVETFGTPVEETLTMNVSTEQAYAESFSDRGFTLGDFIPPPYELDDGLTASIAFDLDGERHVWSTQSSSDDCSTLS